MKKVLFISSILVLVLCSNVFAYDFKAVTPSGHTLRFQTIEGRPTEVIVIRDYDTVGFYLVAEKYTGDLIIPDTVVAPNGYKYIVRAIDSEVFTVDNNVYTHWDYWAHIDWDTVDTSSYVGISSVVIPSTVEYIGAWAFGANPMLKSVTFGSSPITIYDWAFANCPNIKSIVIPNLFEYGENVFAGCKRLETVYVDGKGDNSYYDNGGLFSGCVSLKKVFINCDYIDKVLFGGCNKIEELEIGDSVKYIYVERFVCCDSLKKLTLGKSLKRRDNSNFDKETFYNCIILDSVIFKGEEPPTPYWDYPSFADVKPGVHIIVPCGCAQKYSESALVQGSFAYPEITEDCSNVGIEDDSVSLNLKIYTRNGRIFLQDANGEDCYVYDVNGRLVERFSNGSSSRSLPSGVYLVKVGELPSKKVVVIQ